MIKNTTKNPTSYNLSPSLDKFNLNAFKSSVQWKLPLFQFFLGLAFSHICIFHMLICECITTASVNRGFLIQWPNCSAMWMNFVCFLTVNKSANEWTINNWLSVVVVWICCSVAVKLKAVFDDGKDSTPRAFSFILPHKLRNLQLIKDSLKKSKVE